MLTDQLRYPPEYESEELANYRHEQMPGQQSLRESGVSFRHHYPIAAACAAAGYFANTRIMRDAAGHPRCVIATRE